MAPGFGGATPGPGSGIASPGTGAGGGAPGRIAERRYQLSPAPAASPLARRYSNGPAATGPASENASAAVVAPLTASTTRMPSASVEAPAPLRLVMPTAVLPDVLPPETISRSEGAPSAPSSVCRSSRPPAPE